MVVEFKETSHKHKRLETPIDEKHLTKIVFQTNSVPNEDNTTTFICAGGEQFCLALLWL